MTNPKTIPGIIHGSTIELTQNPGFLEGQAVEVIVQAAIVPSTGVSGIHRSAGALADEWSNEDDQILAEIYEDRQRAAIREISE